MREGVTKPEGVLAHRMWSEYEGLVADGRYWRREVAAMDDPDVWGRKMPDHAEVREAALNRAVEAEAAASAMEPMLSAVWDRYCELIPDPPERPKGRKKGQTRA